MCEVKGPRHQQEKYAFELWNDRAPVRESGNDADMLAEALSALSCEAEGYAVACQSGELMSACAKANKVWTAYQQRRRS